MEFKFRVQTKIQKPIAEVFDAVYNPKKLSGYFTNGGSSGPLDEDKTVTWTFADDPKNKMDVPVKVQKMISQKLIRFSWPASEGAYDPKTKTYPHPGGYDTLVEMTFESTGINETLVSIAEGTWRSTPDG